MHHLRRYRLATDVRGIESGHGIGDRGHMESEVGTHPNRGATTVDGGQSDNYDIRPTVAEKKVLQTGSDKGAIDRLGQDQFTSSGMYDVLQGASGLPHSESRMGLVRVVLHDNSRQVRFTPPTQQGSNVVFGEWIISWSPTGIAPGFLEIDD